MSFCGTGSQPASLTSRRSKHAIGRPFYGWSTFQRPTSYKLAPPSTKLRADGFPVAGDSSDSDPRGELEEHHKDAYGWALNCCDRRREDAEDVLQTVYLKVLGGKARFNGNSSFRTWLFALIRNTAADRRRSWFRRLLGEQKMAPSPITPSPDQSALATQRAALIETALQRLTARQRESLHLVFYQGMTLEQATEVMGISIGSARTHYERGKAKLRQSLRGVLE